MDYSTPPPGQSMQNQNKVDLDQVKQQLAIMQYQEIVTVLNSSINRDI